MSPFRRRRHGTSTRTAGRQTTQTAHLVGRRLEPVPPQQAGHLWSGPASDDHRGRAGRPIGLPRRPEGHRYSRFQPATRRSEHPLGTDDLGRDMLARCLYGGRISLSVGFVAMLIAMFVGTTVGLFAGYVRRLDNLLMRFTDMMLTLPQMPLLLVAMSLFRDPLRNDLRAGNGRLHHGGHDHRHLGLDAHRAHGARFGAVAQAEGVCRGGGQRRRTQRTAS